MGQRTCILLKKNFGNNESTITLIHHQWGIGKVMPSLLLQEVLKELYPLDGNLLYTSSEELPINLFYTFKPLNNSHSNYITNRKVKTDDPNEDIWKPDVRVRYGNMTDNNNGMMLVEVTQKYDEDGKPKTYGNTLEVKVGFALGNEEVHFWHNRFDSCIEIESEFVRLVSMEEYALRTLGSTNPEIQKETKQYIKYVTGILNYAGVQQIYDKTGNAKRNRKEAHIRNVIEGLAKANPTGTLEVPPEFKIKEQIYA